MSDKKTSLPNVRTPRVRLAWPKLTEPDYGNEKFPKPDGEFSTKFLLDADAPATKAFLAKLQPIQDQAEAEAQEAFKALKAEVRKKLGGVKMNPLFTELLDQETEEPTGELEFKAARKASGEFKKGPKKGQKWTAVLPIFDARGTPMKKLPKIFGGTVAILSVQPSVYFIPGTGAAGVKLNLEAVQIIELKSGSRDAKGYGFGAEEGGYEHDDSTDESGGRFADESGEQDGGAEQTPDF